MKLTPKQIEFIDAYLFKKCDIFYTDIRVEMMDHIATAVENKMEQEDCSFFNTFKNYMVKNKEELLKENKMSVYNLASIKSFLKFLANPYVLVFGVLWFLILYLSNGFQTAVEVLSVNFYYLLAIVMMVLFIEGFYLNKILKKRFYSIEKSWQTLIFIYGILYFINTFVGVKLFSVVNLYGITIFTFVLIGQIIFFITQILKAKKQYYNLI